MRATANPHERPVSGIQIDALNGENGTRCGQTASRWANGRFWWKLLFEAKLATTHIGRELPPVSYRSKSEPLMLQILIIKFGSF
ncbi:hypothetical protein QCD71_18875 [Sphingomonas sp. PsM26]|nr:hypothetical protein [Sphingomonas sp. PsM26]